MNPIVLAVVYLVGGAVLGQIIRNYYAAAKEREQRAQAALVSDFNYVHRRINDLVDHFQERVKSTEQSISAHTQLLESHAKQLAGDVKGDVKAAGKKI